MKVTLRSDHSLPTLKSAVTRQDLSSSSENDEKTYKSGATFKGRIEDNKKVGLGVFVWPNGAQYEGEFICNIRHGHGKQIWADGASYEGRFIEDLRDGIGEHHWSNGEEYAGQFFRDRRHGRGTYKWPDGSAFSGLFYMDKKEGYGIFTYPDGSQFEGLYRADEREGPGVLTYTDGKQDVGLWHRERLLKICTPIEGAFTMSDHAEFEYNPAHHVEYIKPDIEGVEHEESRVTGRSSRVRINDNVRRFGDVCSDENEKNLRKIQSTGIGVGGISRESTSASIFSETLDPRSAAIDRKIFDTEYFKQNTMSSEDLAADEQQQQQQQPVKILNKTPSCVEIQKHVLKHDSFSGDCSFDVAAIMRGDRSGFSGERGAIELASEQLIQASMNGDLTLVAAILNERKAFVDVADKNGFTSLIAASVNWFKDVINCLLDHGADVNKMTDEGMSSLATCCVFFYPIDRFKQNIAETTIADNAPEVKGEHTDVKGIMKETHGDKKSERKKPANLKKASTVGGKKLNVETNRKKTEQPVAAPTRTLASSEVIDPHHGTGDNTARVKLNTTRERSTSDEGSDAGQDVDEYRTDLLTPFSDFESNVSMRNYSITVTNQLVERCATTLSRNESVMERCQVGDDGTARQLAVKKSEYTLMESTIQLLLQRGADPNAASVPMPALFFAVKAADVEMVRLLLLKGASTESTLAKEKGGLAALHISCALPGEEGVQITRLLLDALANPDVRSAEDETFLNKLLYDEWIKDQIDDVSRSILGGRTPLHIACARDDDYEKACRVVHLLLDHHADPNLLCNGHSPLSLAITSGNDLAIDELLLYGANPSLRLTHGIGSAFCVASSTEYEHRRPISSRLNLIDKLVKSGANVLAPILIGPKRIPGTAVDYAYYMYNLDRRIAHMPYHALTPAERDTFNDRRQLLAHVGAILREKAVLRERYRLEMEELGGIRSRSPSPSFVYTGTGAAVPPGGVRPRSTNKGGVSFNAVTHDSRGGQTALPDSTADIRHPILKYCYECGRSVGVRLAACTRCKEVYYCSKACKLKAWNTRHKEECIRIGGRSPSPGGTRGKRVDSPTPTTNPNKKLPATVNNLMGDRQSNRVKVPFKGRSRSADRKRTGNNLYSNINNKTGGPPSAPNELNTNPNMDNYSFN
ncbi:ankyrin repeat and MYND domain-containing protein 1-like isoform X2 [Tubulanus polymorphus]|uniref:ankyrin repeat and MYND domain-containing protein 1-like isoform X2 n=1 Tax=Tubulanus polymorphus TaxID=672921 RepID=UPI003DA406D6